MNRSRWQKGILVALVFCGLFAASVFVETSLRAAKTESIPVDSTLAPGCHYYSVTNARLLVGRNGMVD